MAERTCSIDGCERRHYARGWCMTHWKRWSTTGDASPDVPIRNRAPSGTPCRVTDCGKPVKGAALCSMHHQRFLRHGSTDAPQRSRPVPAAIDCRRCFRTRPARDFPPKRRICKECRSARNKAWRLENRDRLASDERRRRLKNRVRNAERARAYREANREILRMKARIRDAASKRLRAADSNLTQAGITARIDYYGSICWICRVAPYEHLDHVKPLSKGGSNLLSNIRPACAPCNLAKGSIWPFAPSMLREEVSDD